MPLRAKGRLAARCPRTRPRSAACRPCALEPLVQPRRTAECVVGSSSGTSPSDRGKGRLRFLAIAHRRRVPSRAPMRRACGCRACRLGFCGAGRLARTRSSRCSARSPRRSSKRSSWQSRRRFGSCSTGCSSVRTTSLSMPSESPTTSRTSGRAAASRTAAGRSSPSWKICSACRSAIVPASVNATPRPAGLSSGAPELALQFPYLGADRLHRHAQPGRGARHAAFLGDHPEVVEMSVAERQAHTSIKRNELFVIVCFFGKPSTAIVVPSSPKEIAR